MKKLKTFHTGILGYSLFDIVNPEMLSIFPNSLPVKTSSRVLESQVLPSIPNDAAPEVVHPAENSGIDGNNEAPEAPNQLDEPVGYDESFPMDDFGFEPVFDNHSFSISQSQDEVQKDDFAYQWHSGLHNI
jgi:hypothetical protein